MKSKKLMKFDIGKARFSLYHPKALHAIAEVFTYGARKYEDWNWLKGTNWSRYYDALQRHLNAFWGREDRDIESKLLHLAHAGCCVFILLTYQILGVGNDDRPQNNKIQ